MSVYSIISSVIIGLWAGLFTGLLTDEDEVLGFIPRLYRKVLGLTENDGLVGWKYTIAKPLFLCAVCHAGQVAFWSYFLIFPGWQFFHHIAFVVVAMFTAHEAAKRFGTWN